MFDYDIKISIELFERIQGVSANNVYTHGLEKENNSLCVICVSSK